MINSSVYKISDFYFNEDSISKLISTRSEKIQRYKEKGISEEMSNALLFYKLIKKDVNKLNQITNEYKNEEQKKTADELMQTKKELIAIKVSYETWPEEVYKNTEPYMPIEEVNEKIKFYKFEHEKKISEQVVFYFNQKDRSISQDMDHLVKEYSEHKKNLEQHKNQTIRED